jgi:hypothetical protein
VAGLVVEAGSVDSGAGGAMRRPPRGFYLPALAISQLMHARSAILAAHRLISDLPVDQATWNFIYHPARAKNTALGRNDRVCV